ncbi:Helicase conserved C-terminal domain containing protein [Trichomonas vaginalis G3]|uniref:RNA helicase n=1 Tax=Trichomonas vaginalis (strain ATCC PRA-98 / G3) TaxID=412133 RepID=A2EAG9_TRIV3|nr:Helicase conserved C-terminal domain containing protein [Trichomonas vaginalis G3]|eukprot:XP_001322619.1 helicase [Trichomonas vaginalis G3]
MLAIVLNALLRVDRNVNKVQIVILLPNMELLDQIEEYFEKLTPEDITYTKINSCSICIDNLGQIIFSSPGLFFNAANMIPALRDVSVLIIDECDEVITNKIYHEDLIKYVGQIKNAQFLLYSATFVDVVNNFINKFSPNIARIILPQNNNIKHFYIDCRNIDDTIPVIAQLFPFISQSQTFIFFNTRRYIQAVQQLLEYMNIACEWCSPDRTKDDRREVVKKFRNQQFKVLLTTNLLARGIDIPSCNVVINFDMPRMERFEPDYDSYLHRSGRCGRFGKEGKVFNIVKYNDDMHMLCYLYQNYSIEFTPITPDEISKFIKLVF